MSKMSWQPVCAMKTRIDGYFYVPNLDVHTLKVELLFTDAELEGDQTGGTSPYPNITHYPDGNVDIYDQTLITGSAYGTSEGESGWEYMADINADKTVDIFDLTIVNNNYGKTGGVYDTDLTGVTIEFDTGDVNSPNSDGYVSIPSEAKYFYVKKNGNPIGALITFYTETLVTYNLTINVDKDSGYINDVFTFTGVLTQDGTAISGATVTLYKDSTSIGSDTTKTDGSYQIQWIADSIGTYNFHTEANF